MALVRGPFDIVWGGNTLANIEEIEVEHEQDSEEYSTVQHQTFELDGAMKSSVSLTLLASDIPALAVVLPQYHIANGGVMSTGETVSNADGAIDVSAASCDSNPVYNNLDIISCGNPGQVFRLVHSRTKLDSIEFDDKIRKIVVKFIGEPASGDANVQFFKEGSINVVS